MLFGACSMGAILDNCADLSRQSVGAACRLGAMAHARHTDQQREDLLDELARLLAEGARILLKRGEHVAPPEDHPEVVASAPASSPNEPR